MLHRDSELDLYLIRHGESAGNRRDPRAPYDPDSELTPRGREQMTLLGRRLLADRVVFDAVYSSTLKRAIGSAEAMLSAMGSRVRFERVRALDELRVAIRDGQPIDQRLNDQELRSYERAGPWWVYGEQAGEGVESERMLQRRVMSWIEDRLINDTRFLTPGGTSVVAMVTHGGAIRTALQSILGFDATFIRRFQIDNASISRLRFNASGWFPVSINDAWHARDARA